MKRPASSPKSSQPRTSSRAGLSTASLVPSRLYNYVLIVLLALSVASCRSTKTTVRQTVAAYEESEEVKEENEVRLSSIEATSATLRQTLTLSPDTLTWTVSRDPAGRVVKVMRAASMRQKVTQTAAADTTAHSSMERMVSLMERHMRDSAAACEEQQNATRTASESHSITGGSVFWIALSLVLVFLVLGLALCLLKINH